MTMHAPSAPLDLQVTARADRSILRRLIHWLIEGRERKARLIMQYLDSRPRGPQDNFRVEFERRMMGQ
jgi:hypothetical protein